MKYFLGIDGGGTKTKFTLCTEDGTVFSEYTGRPCHYLQCGFDGLTAIIEDGIKHVTEKADLTPGGIAFAFAGCAGYGDVAKDDPKIRSAIISGMGDIPCEIGNDSENALVAGIGDRSGINIIAGTGSVGCGINAAGDHQRCGGWHYALGGDEGSGYWISWNMLKEFQRQSDGRDDRTLLYDELRSSLNISTDDEIVTRIVEEWNLDRTKIAALAPICLKLYKAGDPHAKAILASAAKELGDFAISLYRRLGFSDSSASVPVSGTGGIFKMGAPVTEPFAQILSLHGMEYVEPLLEPDLGAVLLAMKCSGMQITDSVIEQMRISHI